VKQFQQSGNFLVAIGLVITVIQGGIGLLSWDLISGSSAWAQSGGRTRGGSFDRPTSPAPPSSYPSDNYSSPYDYSRPNDRSNSRPYYPSQPGYFPGSYRRPPVIVVPPQSYPVDPYGYGTSSSGDSLFLVLVLVCGISVLPVISAYLRQGRSSHQTSRSAVTNEITNDIVTVTQLQVALLAQARYIQEALTALSLKANLNTPEGLARLLQETVLALLRSPENWTHARILSQTVESRQEAARVFEQFSIQSRSKLSAETLVNVGGQIQRQQLVVDADADPASYIVVTLLLGTADDRPLTQEIYAAEELQNLLKRLGGITPAYLLIFELIWTPQDPADSLSRQQLLTLYPDLIQIA
jgi:uncharacterized membrane protein